jgi:hypothetical protein
MVVDKSSRRKTAQHPRYILIFTSSHGHDNYSREKEKKRIIMGSEVVVITSKIHSGRYCLQFSGFLNQESVLFHKGCAVGQWLQRMSPPETPEP